MTNKFLDQYPQLRKPRVGDCVKVIQILNISKEKVPAKTYQIGDEGVIRLVLNEFALFDENLYEIDFLLFKNALLFREEFVLIGISNE